MHTCPCPCHATVIVAIVIITRNTFYTCMYVHVDKFGPIKLLHLRLINAGPEVGPIDFNTSMAMLLGDLSLICSAYDKKLTLSGHDVPTKYSFIESVCILTSTFDLTNK